MDQQQNLLHDVLDRARVDAAPAHERPKHGQERRQQRRIRRGVAILRGRHPGRALGVGIVLPTLVHWNGLLRLRTHRVQQLGAAPQKDHSTGTRSFPSKGGK